MQCPFCQLDMKSIDNGTPGPRLSMFWVCKNCPHEVRISAEKDIETEQHWITRSMSIFVFHKDKEYCLHWNYIGKVFSIVECSATSGLGIVLSLKTMPTTVTPENAYDKFLTYITFS
jgi:hypothetical protein